jgi:hypothetical protein
MSSPRWLSSNGTSCDPFEWPMRKMRAVDPQRRVECGQHCVEEGGVAVVALAGQVLSVL